LAISGNISTSQGDSFLIRAEVPIIGLIGLTDFIDTTTGSFYKEFRYATDGINFVGWRELTADNLSQVSVEATDNFLIEYRYTNILNSNATFTDVQVSGSFTAVTCGEYYQKSIFNDFFTCYDNEVLQWCVNVTSKLYKQGIVPNFITRGDESNINGADRDYIDFWRSVACFFAYIVVFARKFKDFRANETLLEEFLVNRGIYFCDTNTKAEKDYLVESYFDEIRQRGTSRIYKTKTENSSTVDGELLRLICHSLTDEFIFNLHLPHTIGHSVGNSSPLYKGLSNQKGVNKSYEITDDFVNLLLYPTFGNGTQDIITDGSKEVYSILNVPDTEIAGLGDSDTDFAINIDNGLDYEITFYCRQPVAEANLTFGVLSYDSDDVSTTLNEITGGTAENNFFEKIQLANATDYFFFRGIIYNKNADPLEVPNDCLGGTNLQFKADSGKIIPYIALDNSTGGDAVNELRIWNLRIKPVSSNYSTGFINPKNMISIWANHKNPRYSRNELEGILKDKLLPYNSFLKFNYLNDDFAISS
jgi:hypothetical protein